MLTGVFASEGSHGLFFEGKILDRETLRKMVDESGFYYRVEVVRRFEKKVYFKEEDGRYFFGLFSKQSVFSRWMVGRDGGFLITAANLTVFMAMCFEDYKGVTSTTFFYLSRDYFGPEAHQHFFCIPIFICFIYFLLFAQSASK